MGGGYHGRRGGCGMLSSRPRTTHAADGGWARATIPGLIKVPDEGWMECPMRCDLPSKMRSSKTRTALACLSASLAFACHLGDADTGDKGGVGDGADSGGDGGGGDGGGGDGGGGDGGTNLSLLTSTGVTGRLVDTDIADGPGILREEGGLEQGILSFQDDETGAFFDLSLLGGSDGIGQGSVCRDFGHQAESVGCQWFAGGSSSVPLSDGRSYDSLEWTETDGELRVSAFAEEGSAAVLSLDFWLELVGAGGETLRIEGAVDGGRLSP